MSETNNAINLLVQLGIDTNASKSNLDTQIEKLSKQLNNLDLRVDIDKNAIKALQDLASLDLKGLSDTIKGAGKGIGGLGDEAKGAGNEIKKNFSDVQKSLDTTFNHLSKDFQQAIKKGITSVDELQNAFRGMQASYKMDYEVIGTDSANRQIKRVRDIEVAYKNLQGQIEKVKFNNSSAIDMGNGELQNLWLPSNTSKVIDNQMKQVETSISNAVKKSQEELHKLVRSGEITEQQFHELSKASNNILHPNSIHLYNQRLTETLNNNKQLTFQKKEQLALEERIRKLQNSIITAQQRDPKGLGNNSQLSGMLESLKSINPASDGASKAVKNVSDSFDLMKSKATEAGRSSLTVMDSFKIAMEKFPVWMAASTAFFGTVRSIKSAFQEIVELDSQMTVLRRVSGMGTSEVNKTLEESIRLAGELGNRIADINDGFIAFARQGFKGDDLYRLAEVATLLGNVSDLSVDESASTITAALKGFNIEAEKSLHVVNAMNEVDNNYSITTNQLATALQKSAGAASTYQVSLEKSIGMTTAIGEVTRESGSVIGNSLKSIYSRITSIQPAIDAMAEIGINIRSSSGELRSVSDILDDLGGKWKSLSTEQQQNLGLQIAGRYQLSRFLILMNQYDTVLSATRTAEESAGSALRENAEYLKSYSARINNLRNSWTEAVVAMRDNGGLGDFITISLETGLEFFKTMTYVIDKVGLLPSALGVAGLAFLLFSKNADIAKVSTNGFLLSGLQRIPIVGKLVTAELSTMSIGMQRFAAGTGIAATSVGALRTALSIAFPIAAIMAVGAGISWVTSKISEQIEKQKTLKKEFEEFKQKSIDAVSTNKTQVNELIASYSKLEGMKLSGDWDTDKDQEYLRIQQELADLFPTLVDRIDAKGQAHLKTSQEINKEVEAANKLYEAEQRLKLVQAEETYKEKIKEIKDYIKELEHAEATIEKSVASRSRQGSTFQDIEIENAKAASDKLVYQKMIESTVSGFREQFIDHLSTQMTLAGEEVAPILQEAVNKALSSVDFSALNETQLIAFRGTLADLSNEMNQAFKSGDRDTFNQLSKDLQDVLISMGATEAEAKKLSPTFNGVKSASDNLAKSMAENAKITDEFSDSMDGLGDSASAAADDIYKPKDALEALTGVSTKLLSDVDDMIFAFDSLSGRASLTAEESERLASTQSALLSMFPELSSSSMELVDRYEYLSSSMRGSTVASEELAEIERELLRIHPSLVDSGLSRANIIQEVIKNIKEEVRANDILLAATKAMRDGKLKAEEQSALASLQNTNARIQNINSEILALDKLERAYAIFNDSQRGAALDAARQMGMGSVLATSFKATDYAIQLTAESKRKSSLTELATLTSDRTKYTDILSKSEEVLKNTTTAGNKAIADKIKNSKTATKAQKEAAKAMEESTFRANKYKMALEELNLKIKEQQDIQSQFPDYTSKHQAALQAELKLQQDKMNLLMDQEKNLQAQIKAGNILKTGVITTKSGGGGTQKLSGWGGAITSQFGRRFHPIDKVWKNHDGIDIAGKNGTRVDSNVSGTVTFAGNKGNGLGNYVAIKDASGNTNIYGHLEKVLVKAGQSIAQGVTLGTIGSTGKSTGNHLHYQVNDPSGKAINPSSYVDSARKGISSASKEVAQVQADIEGAKSELTSLQGQIIDQSAGIRDLEAKLLNATFAGYDRQRVKNQQIIDYEIAKLREVDVSSDRYSKTLDKVASHLKAKQRVNQEELTALEKLIRTGGLTGETLEKMKDRVWELKTEMFSLNEEISNIDLDKLNALMSEHEDAIDGIVYEYQRAEAVMALYEEGTADFNEQLANVIQGQKAHRDAVKEQISALQQEMLTMNLGSEEIKNREKQIRDLTLEYWNLSSSVLNSEKSLEASRKKMAEEAAEAYISAYKSYITEKRDMTMRSYDELDRAEDKRHKQVMDNYKKESDAFRKIIQEKLDAIDKEESERSYGKEIDKLEEERLKVLNKLNLLSLDDSLEAKAERKKLSEELAKIDDDLFEKRNAKEISDRKDNLNNMLKDKEEQVQKEEQLAEEQHEAAKDRIDKERRYWEQFYTDQLNDERKFAKMKEDIVAGNFDNMSKEFQDYIKEMEDTMPDLVDTLDGSMQAVGTSIRQNLIDNLREALDMLARVDANNIAATNPAPGGTGSLGTGAGGSLGSSSAQSKTTLSSADLQVLTGKFYNDRLANAETNPVRKGKIKEKAYELANSGRSSGSSISSNEGFDSIIAGLSQADREALGKHLSGSGSQHVSTPELQDFIKRFGQSLMNSSIKLSTGGYVKKGSQGLAMLHEEEVVLNKPETKKLFDLIPVLEKLNTLLSPLTMPRVKAPELAGTNGDSYTFEFYVDKMNAGSERQVDDFAKKINDKLKRNKGMR